MFRRILHHPQGDILSLALKHVGEIWLIIIIIIIIIIIKYVY